MTQDGQQSTLGVFFTYGVSLSVWEQRGMLQREITYYEELAKKFARVYFFTYGKENRDLVARLHEKGIVVKEKKSFLPNFIYSFVLPWLYKKELQACSVYKTNQMFGSWSAVIAKMLYHKKLIVRTGFTLSIFAQRRNWLKLVFARMIERFALSYGDTCIVATEEEKNYFSKYKDKIVVIPNFVDTTVFQPLRFASASSQKKTVLFVGRLSAQKNLKNLLFAIKGLEGVKLQIIGSGEEQKDLERIVLNENVAVEFLGNKPYEEIPQFLSRADVFVLPSLYEGNPKVLLEAMACGCPIVATRVSGIENIITHKENGYLCSTDTMSIHDALQTVLEDEPLQKSMSEKAVLFIQKKYSIPFILEQEEAVYNKLGIL